MSARRFTDEDAIAAIRNTNNRSIKAVLRQLGVSAVSGSNYDVIYRIVQQNNLDTSHWLGKRIGILATNVSRKTNEQFFVANSGSHSHSVRLRLFSTALKKRLCESCGGVEWLGKPIPLEVDHINGDRRDNQLENLRILCPNCHAQTPTYKTKNRKR